MQLGIAHYHLNVGGVTRVIRNHLVSLAQLPAGDRPDRVTLFYGGRSEGWVDPELPFPVRRVALEGLDYAAPGERSSMALADRWLGRLRQLGMPPEITLLQIHNHALGKNPSLPMAVCRLADAGYRLLLQLHDFVEDARPANYCALLDGLGAEHPQDVTRWLYPVANHVWYAVINGRDRQILARAGIPRERLVVLPNPVVAPPVEVDRPRARRRVAERLGLGAHDRYVLYPVRGIRRKNLGEFCLWAALHPSATAFGLTLAPQNPAERPNYEFWRKAAASWRLPAHFDVTGSSQIDYAHHRAAADCMMTTSVAEGFGMVFLEPWLEGLPLVGRDLPDITADFRQAGLTLDHVYTNLWIPLDWIDRQAMERDLLEHHRNLRDAYQMSNTWAPQADQAIRRRLEAEHLDFASFPRSWQAEVVDQVVRRPERREVLRAINPQLCRALAIDRVSLGDMIARNAELVTELYHPRCLARRLGDLLVEIGAVSPSPLSVDAVDGSAIIGQFLDPDHLAPVRFE